MTQKHLGCWLWKIKQGLYIRNFDNFNPNKLEIYKVYKQEDQFLAIDIEGNTFPLEDTDIMVVKEDT